MYGRLRMNRKLIIAIVGKSGTGKTTLGRYLSKHLHYNWICSYTTREMREGEIDGIDHKFVNESDMPDKKDMMAYTNFANNHYWTTFDQFDEILPNVYAIDEKGLIEMESMIVSNRLNYDLLKVFVDRKDIDVDKDRQKRDEERESLPECYYDIVLRNDCDLKTFLENSTREINEVVNLIRN